MAEFSVPSPEFSVLSPIAAGSALLEAGASFTLTTRAVPGNSSEASIPYRDLPSRTKAGDRMLLADGAMELEVTGTTSTDIRCRVVVGGELGSHKGINLPDSSVEISALTDKDRRDLLFGISAGVDWVALSFVRDASDIEEARAIMKQAGARIPILAKIEKHEALPNFPRILEAADGILIARGDLGVETPLERVPLVQKRLIQETNRAGRPVVTATQMLRSMVESPRPTRAEVADVANAILDGSDAVMLSEESASGKYPVRAVEVMDKIIRETEQEAPFRAWHVRVESDRTVAVEEAVGEAACHLATNTGASCIVSFTRTGDTARLVAKYRPSQPIVAASPQEDTCRRLMLVWGVVPVLVDGAANGEELVTSAVDAARRAGLAEPGDRVVITAGLPAAVAGATNFLRVEAVPRLSVKSR